MPYNTSGFEGTSPFLTNHITFNIWLMEAKKSGYHMFLVIWFPVFRFTLFRTPYAGRNTQQFGLYKDDGSKEWIFLNWELWTKMLHNLVSGQKIMHLWLNRSTFDFVIKQSRLMIVSVENKPCPGITAYPQIDSHYLTLNCSLVGNKGLS